MKHYGKGEFDRKISLQDRTVTTDGYGGRSEAWAEIGQVWAKFVPQPMQGVALAEMADQPQMLEKATFVFETPLSYTVPTTARIVYSNAVWKVIGRAEAGTRGQYTQLNAVKTDSDILD